MLECLLNVIDRCQHPESRTKLESVAGAFVTGIIVWELFGGGGALAGILGVLCAYVYLCRVCVCARVHVCACWRAPKAYNS